MGRKGPKSGPWTLEAKLRTRRPGVRIPHGVPIMAVTLWVIAIIAFPHPEGFEVYAPEGQTPHGVPEKLRNHWLNSDKELIKTNCCKLTVSGV